MVTAVLVLFSYEKRPMMSGTILCGVNDSPSARAALQLAAALSERLRMRLVVAYIAPEAAADEAKRLVSRVLERASLDGSADRRVGAGEPAGRLAQIAAEEGADLIIVGSSRDGRLRLRPESTLASELETATSCPVLIAPAQTRPRSNQRLARAVLGTGS
jgi:nucleotide-binding universal stress UspA family protein